MAGVIEATLQGETWTNAFQIVPWKLNLRHETPEKLEPEQIFSEQFPIAKSRTLRFFESYLGRWRKDSLAIGLGEVDDEVRLYNDLIKMGQEMDEVDLFEPDIHCLCHLDLHNPRNIMVQIDNNGSLRVTGILDWDEAVVAPKFVNCEPLGWLRGYDKDTHVDENDMFPWPYELEGANNEPSSPEQQELKALFERNAGPEYPRLAYAMPSRFARTIFRIATLGLAASWHYDAAERILREWEALRPALVPISR